MFIFTKILKDFYILYCGNSSASLFGQLALGSGSVFLSSSHRRMLKERAKSLASLAKSKHRTAIIGKMIIAVQTEECKHRVWGLYFQRHSQDIFHQYLTRRSFTLWQQTEMAVLATLTRTVTLLSVNSCLYIICMLIVLNAYAHTHTLACCTIHFNETHKPGLTLMHHLEFIWVFRNHTSLKRLCMCVEAVVHTGIYQGLLF